MNALKLMELQHRDNTNPPPVGSPRSRQRPSILRHVEGALMAHDAVEEELFYSPAEAGQAQGFGFRGTTESIHACARAPTDNAVFRAQLGAVSHLLRSHSAAQRASRRARGSVSQP
jgi:hypothetical protein